MFIVLLSKWTNWGGGGTREENMGYWDKVGCRLNMKINPETERQYLLLFMLSLTLWVITGIYSLLT